MASRPRSFMPGGSVLIKACLNGGTTRVGLEDTVVLEDGRPASGNSELVRAAARLASEAR